MSGDQELDRADKLGLVVGLKHLGKPVARHDIDALLLKEPDTFNLFLLAFQELKADEDWNSRSMSFWQIAGIHGLPNFNTWNGVEGKNVIAIGKDDDSGYCAHGKTTFPTWHRPYLALLEQALYRKMLQIAAKYNEPRKSAYLKAVEKFRLPYWDYHRPRNYDARFTGIIDKDRTTSFPYDFSVPQIFTLPKIKVRKYPNDNLDSIDNPLLSFNFPQPKGSTEAMTKEDWRVSGINPSDGMKLTTTRWRQDKYPDSVDRLNQAVNEYREDAVRISLVLAENGVYNRYEVMATALATAEDPVDGKKVTGSLENVHNNYHIYVGGDPWKRTAGHMGSVPVAAFDPIFWFHHCQIDRWFAVWQAAKSKIPQSWFADQDVAKTNLLPFLTTPLTDTKKPICWNSDQSRHTSDFGYTYADIENMETGHDQEVQNKWEGLYGWARRLKVQKKGDVWKAPPDEMKPFDLSAAQFFQGVPEFKPLKPAPSLKIASPTANLSKLVVSDTDLNTNPEFSSNPAAHITEDNASREWYVDMAVKKLALNTAFSVMYFIGPRDPDGDSFMLDPSFAGLTHIFTAPSQACADCKEADDKNVKVTGTAPITSLLLDYVFAGALQSMKPEHVQPFLIKYLKWLIISTDGVRHDTRDLARDSQFGLNVTCKVAPLEGQTGSVVYESYPAIIAEIIRNSS